MITQTTLRERLMEHMQVLCKQIGARPTGTRAEQRAAEYVRQQLWALDVKDVREQPFETPRSLGYGVIPFLLAAALAVPLGRDRKSTRLNSSHVTSSYAVLCL